MNIGDKDIYAVSDALHFHRLSRETLGEREATRRGIEVKPCRKGAIRFDNPGEGTTINPVLRCNNWTFLALTSSPG
ncbi:MAG: hypothetical protein RIM23_09680 [Coleofasciculus sp. G3-WIS-01]